MAYCGPWGCYIHIPKTSGQWVKKVLSKRGGDFRGRRDGSLTHDLPVQWDYDQVWTVVREPAEWLASVWAHRVRERWHPYPRRVPWQLFCEMLIPIQDNKFAPFVRKVTERYPGIVGWIYGVYTPPGVKIIRKEDELYPWLREMGYAPDREEPANIGPNRDRAVITPAIRAQIYAAEDETYQKYGYPPD